MSQYFEFLGNSTIVRDESWFELEMLVIRPN